MKITDYNSRGHLSTSQFGDILYMDGESLVELPGLPIIRRFHNESYIRREKSIAGEKLFENSRDQEEFH